jgi:transcriptional regulator with XRE-family HTH domain
MKKPLCDFGKYVSNLRKNNNLNGTEAAEKAGISQATLSGWEQGKQAPDFEHLVALMRVFKLEWPDTIEFFAITLNTFNGRMAFPINDGIIPKDILINFLAVYFAADGNKDKAKQEEATFECIEKMKKYLEAKIPKFTGEYEEIPPDFSWKSPLPLPKK